MAIGNFALDLRSCYRAGLLRSLDGSKESVFEARVLNPLMNEGPKFWSTLRNWLSLALREGSALQAELEPHLISRSAVNLSVPVDIPDYTDFYCSIEHATNVGKIFRPDEPLLPNFKNLPIAYHGRSSSIVISGTPVTRPKGQRLEAGTIVFGPTSMLDYEVELGAFLGGPTALGDTICLEEAHSHLFGICLLNDWSARDIQAWEYRPLGPFLSKSFATSISGWVVTLEALAPFRVPAAHRAADDPKLLPYLDGAALSSAGLNIEVEAFIQTVAMRSASVEAQPVSSVNARGLYWTFAQMITHHSSNGCPMQTGDLLGSGTISGSEPGTQGSLLEITGRGAQELQLSGERRRFLQDGDTVILRGRCHAPGARSIGFGESVGVIMPARI